MGRLANHSKKCTAFVQLVVASDNVPHLCLFAKRELRPGEQITYDYGINVPFTDLVCVLLYTISLFLLRVLMALMVTTILHHLMV